MASVWGSFAEIKSQRVAAEALVPLLAACFSFGASRRDSNQYCVVTFAPARGQRRREPYVFSACRMQLSVVGNVRRTCPTTDGRGEVVDGRGEVVDGRTGRRRTGRGRRRTVQFPRAFAQAVVLFPQKSGL